jgi:hypothetical protein
VLTSGLPLGSFVPNSGRPPNTYCKKKIGVREPVGGKFESYAVVLLISSTLNVLLTRSFGY